MYVAPRSWRVESVRRHLDAAGEVYITSEIDFDELDRFMFETDAPYEKRRSSEGGAQLTARGRAAVCLAVWLEGLLEGVPTFGDRGRRE